MTFISLKFLESTVRLPVDSEAWVVIGGGMVSRATAATNFSGPSDVWIGLNVWNDLNEWNYAAQPLHVVLNSLQARREKQFLGVRLLLDHPLLEFVANGRL